MKQVPVAILGRWRITWMETWDEEAIDLLGPAFVEFDAQGGGEFTFIAVVGSTHCAYKLCDDLPQFDFTWAGADECERTSGEGWADIQSDGTLAGHISIHDGDESEFTARRW